MELHNDEVPADEVWAVTIENGSATSVGWYITSAAATEQYQFVTAWYARNEGELESDATVARWYVELPRRGMPRDEVDAWANFVLTSQEGGGVYRRRLDVKRFVATGKEATA